MSENLATVDISKFVNRVAKEELDIFNVRVWQDNLLVAAHDWKPVERLDIRSGTKTITSMAVGFAVNEGVFFS